MASSIYSLIYLSRMVPSASGRDSGSFLRPGRHAPVEALSASRTWLKVYSKVVEEEEVLAERMEEVDGCGYWFVVEMGRFSKARGYLRDKRFMTSMRVCYLNYFSDVDF